MHLNLLKSPDRGITVLHGHGTSSQYTALLRYLAIVYITHDLSRPWSVLRISDSADLQLQILRQSLLGLKSSHNVGWGPTWTFNLKRNPIKDGIGSLRFDKVESAAKALQVTEIEGRPTT